MDRVIDESVSQLPPEETRLVTRRPQPIAEAGPSGAAGYREILRAALAANMDAASVEKIAALCERMEDREAAREFAEALAAFQEECPAIVKNRKANIATRSGGEYGYKFADLESIVRIVRPLLRKHGLAFTWNSTEQGGKVTCECILRHVNGHSISASFTATTETSAAMSGAQKHAAAFTFARRQSLTAVLGVVTADTDDDGAGGAVSAQPIDENQAANLRALIDEAKADSRKFLAFFGLKRIEELPAARFKEAVDMLERKRRQS